MTVNDEVNNPLTVILGNTEFIQKSFGATDSATAGRLENIIDSVHRIQDVMERLTQVAQPATKEFIPGTDMLDLDRSVSARESGE